MPRKAKITAVPVEQELQGVFTHMVADQREQQGVSEDPVEQKTDAEQMTDIINEVNTAPQSDAPPLNAEEEVTEKPKPKARVKRAPSRGPSVRLKHNVIEPEPVLTLQVSDQREPEVQAELPVEQVKVEAKVECPDCGKMMSQKTLRYSHGPNCVAKKQQRSEKDDACAKLSHTAKQLAQEVGGEDGEYASHAISMLDSLNRLPDHLVNHMLHTRTRANRATRREAMVAKLIQSAF